MQVHTDIARLPAFQKAVVTIGTFDGVHLGHRKIIARLLEEAGKIGGQTVIITFHPHPRRVIGSGDRPAELLTTITERTDLLRDLGVDHLVIVPFTAEFASLSPADYVNHFLIARFHPHTVIIGYDHRFGKDRRGDYHLLEQYQNSFSLREIPAQLIDDSTVSSTMIRQALRDGNVAVANSRLGYPYFFSGVVERGDQRGRTIGYPTANLHVQDAEKLLPGNGVYAVEVQWPGHQKRGMMNIGVRPTVDGTRKTIEVNIFDFEGDLYGETLRVSLRRFLRPEQKFAGLDALRAQLAVDRQQALA